MKRSEFLSRLIVAVAVIGVIGTPLYLWSRTPIIHARMAENGGWKPDVIQAEAGKPLHLKFTSDDVVHGFAVGQMDMETVDIQPGKVSDITLTFEEPGIYTFYCTRWCGLNHWRMRGTIEVSGSSSNPQPAAPPLYVSLNLDIDAPHDAPSFPMGRPSAVNGQVLVTDFSITFPHEDYLTHSPYQIFDELNDTSLTETNRWDIVAYLWQSNTTLDSLTNGQQLYAQNCAA
ncbi:MAG TPA: cupredoxin domain-containing protein, partial [Anaerolineales bacterium]|nr:cupredoxin domain-containing protein [Anaerolineales bacterium]